RHLLIRLWPRFGIGWSQISGRVVDRLAGAASTLGRATIPSCPPGRRLSMHLRRSSGALIAFVVLIGPVSERAPVDQPRAAEPAAAGQAGQSVKWEGWTFSWSIHPRAGLVLTDVNFRGRKVLKYAGLAEIFVPYNRGQPRPTDFGNGIANQMEEILPGKDCVPGSTRCQAFDRQGREAGKRFVMLHEEPTELSYKGGHGRAYGKKLTLWNV